MDLKTTFEHLSNLPQELVEEIFQHSSLRDLVLYCNYRPDFVCNLILKRRDELKFSISARFFTFDFLKKIADYVCWDYIYKHQ